ncbi:MAG: marine proteobacterial sortase target protein [Rhodovibrionaceae bacterium]|nr:marine proteobacterial sortase target protein [Rhodovibrionaceae bacterium]
MHRHYAYAPSERLTSLAIAILGAIVLVACFAAASPAAPAGSAAQAGHAPSGLFFKTGEQDVLLQAPPMASRMEIDINGIVARATLTQRFANPSDAWLEGVYVFPLPEDAAVDRMDLVIGERVVKGRIMEKEEARKVYEEAAAAGKRAGLLVSERPNVFVTSVANIPPGGAIEVKIRFQSKASFADGRFSLSLPTVVAPRYTPPEGVQGQAHTVGLGPKERRDVFGGFRDPESGEVNRQSLRIELDAGVPLAEVRSLHHGIDVTPRGEGKRLITLSQGSVPATRDFILEWRPHASAVPRAALFAEEVEGDSYLLVMVMPPVDAADLPPVPPRDVVFVIDTSGSMHGDSIGQAKAALQRAIQGLRPEDRFNVIQFNSDTHSLFNGVQPVSARSLSVARSYVSSLVADGGTEMRPALMRALAGGSPVERLRQVVFITDGAIGYEDSFFTQLAQRIGSSRLFTVGIGSAPNAYFMRRAAGLGHGTATFISDLTQVEREMDALLSRLAHPALTDLEVEWQEGMIPETYPARLPDVYLGEPSVFTVRLAYTKPSELRGQIVLKGLAGNRQWSQALPLDDLGGDAGVGKLWAREKLDDIMQGLYRGRPEETVRADALKVALAHDLVTRYTSMVAVEEEPVRPQDEPMITSEVPRDLPEGWSDEKVFGISAERARSFGMQPISSPSPMLQSIARGQSVSLPQTATPAALNYAIGAIFLVLGVMLLAVARRMGPRHV